MSKYLDENGLSHFFLLLKGLFYKKPSGGIPASDLASGVIPDVSGKADLASPTFTGTPTAPTAAASTNTQQIATTAFVTTAVNNAIGSISGISYEIVANLPASGSDGVIYLVSNSGSGTNVYDEYIWVSNKFEKIGTTDVDLSGYLQTTATITNGEIDNIVTAS